jgi:2-phospho-L-lactate guanylyltransferase
MPLWAIVPVKPLRYAKSRLSKVLTREERAKLGSWLLSHTLRVLRDVPQVERIMVVSRDSGVLSMAREAGARTLAERGHPKLNIALTRATMVAVGYGVSKVLILPADLPLLAVADVRAVLALGVRAPVVVIGPDQHHTGTNALLCSPPDLIAYAFGSNSFEMHTERATQAGARVEICKRPGLMFDLDEPADLERFRSTYPEVLQTSAPEG